MCGIWFSFHCRIIFRYGFGSTPINYKYQREMNINRHKLFSCPQTGTRVLTHTLLSYVSLLCDISGSKGSGRTIDFGHQAVPFWGPKFWLYICSVCLNLAEKMGFNSNMHVAFTIRSSQVEYGNMQLLVGVKKIWHRICILGILDMFFLPTYRWGKHSIPHIDMCWKSQCRSMAGFNWI